MMTFDYHPSKIWVAPKDELPVTCTKGEASQLIQKSVHGQLFWFQN